MRAIIYKRSRSGTGVDASRELERYRTLIASRGWEVSEVFIDEGASASTPGLSWVQQVRTHGCDALVAQSAARLSRNASDLASLADADAASVAVLTEDGIMDTSRELGVMSTRIMVKFAGHWDEDREEEARDASED